MNINPKKTFALGCFSVGLVLLVSSASAQLFTDNFDSYANQAPDGISISDLPDSDTNFNDSSPDSNLNGWFSSNMGANQRIVTNTAQLAPGSDRSIALRSDTGFTAQPVLTNYFTDRTGLSDGLTAGTRDVTGSIGESLTGSGVGVSFALRAHAGNASPSIKLFSSSDEEVLHIRITSTTNVNINDTDHLMTSYSNTNFQNFSISNLNTVTGTFDFSINDGDIVSLTGLSFANTVSDIDYFQLYSSDTSSARTMFVDNFSVIPEPSTYAMILGLVALAGIVVRRRLK